jgi:drug/metabolite transporter (DMT)-like permease
MPRSRTARRITSGACVVSGGVLIFLAPEMWLGVVLLVIGLVLEVAGIALERRPPA